MKKHLLFPMIAGLALTFLININLPKPGSNFIYIQQQSLAEFAGKYQLNRPGGPAPFLSISVVDSALVFTQLWDGKKMPVKHLSGDNFIVEGLDWSVQFMRDSNKNITEVVVMGSDHWVKVKS
jgi:hypothetical protein